MSSNQKRYAKIEDTRHFVFDFQKDYTLKKQPLEVVHLQLIQQKLFFASAVLSFRKIQIIQAIK